LGIGANTAIFSVIRGVLLRPLPFPDPDNLMLAVGVIGSQRAGVTAPDFVDWRAQSHTLDLAALRTYNANLTGIDEPERVTAGRVTANYFTTLGVRPVLGRAFIADEEPEGAAHVVVLTEAFWRNRLGGDPTALGRKVTLDDVPYTIVGVMESAAEGLENGENLWVPLALRREELSATGARFLDVVARLRPGITHARASDELQSIATRLKEVRPGSNKDVNAELVPMSEIVVGDSRRPLLLLFGAVGLVLLIACANVAKLLVRASARGRESAIRTALGAGRARLVRQLLTESVLLALIGATGGLLLASWGTGLLVQALPTGTPRLDQVRLDGTVLVFTLLVATLTGIVFGLAPALRAAQPDPVRELAEAARGSGGVHRRRLGAALVVAEIAVALVLLVSAGLLLRSFAAVTRVDPGFDAEHVTALRIALPGRRYSTPAQTVLFYQSLVARARELPGVRNGAVASSVPFGSEGYSLAIAIEGQPAPARLEDTPSIFPRAISAGYFRTMGIRLIAGREFEPGDRAGSVRVGIINETAARRHFPGEDALGRRFTPDDGGAGPIQVVGVVSDVRGFGLASDPRPEVFYPIEQAPPNHWEWTGRAMSLVVNAEGSAQLQAGLRDAVRSLDRSLPIYSIWSATDLIARSVAPRRLFMLLIAGFAAVALLLAAIGVYGVMAFSVSQRTRELGIRVALGAVRQDVMRLVVGRAMTLTGLGLALGAAGALAATRLLTQSLYGVQATDPPTYLAIAALMCVVTLLASYLPARRASRVDPMVALRNE
jgi:putative ABC transport system permease protein